jgi:hypothetical protein
MRKVIFGGANSLDNYFARKDDRDENLCLFAHAETTFNPES